MARVMLVSIDDRVIGMRPARVRHDESFDGEGEYCEDAVSGEPDRREVEARPQVREVDRAERGDGVNVCVRVRAECGGGEASEREDREKGEAKDTHGREPRLDGR